MAPQRSGTSNHVATAAFWNFQSSRLGACCAPEPTAGRVTSPSRCERSHREGNVNLLAMGEAVVGNFPSDRLGVCCTPGPTPKPTRCLLYTWTNRWRGTSTSRCERSHPEETSVSTQWVRRSSGTSIQTDSGFAVPLDQHPNHIHHVTSSCMAAPVLEEQCS